MKKQGFYAFSPNGGMLNISRFGEKDYHEVSGISIALSSSERAIYLKALSLAERSLEKAINLLESWGFECSEEEIEIL